MKNIKQETIKKEFKQIKATKEIKEQAEIKKIMSKYQRSTVCESCNIKFDFDVSDTKTIRTNYYDGWNQAHHSDSLVVNCPSCKREQVAEEPTIKERLALKKCGIKLNTYERDYESIL